jgi:excisionase family DNA binding protein
MIILQGLTVEEFFSRIETIIEKKLEEKIKIEKAVHLMSRKEVAVYFKVSIVTIHNWTKEGILPSHRVGSRIFYKSNEIEEVVTKIKKYKRGSYL